ncbi:hypothetical protein JV16_00433 [Anoxybacillus ayderensis]|uniref:Uncharacterized protein n=1 Tax=Anoxybacillus ayderensis TaxID=265546 RepID=A0A0D0HYF5_9BACL|nr:hypothetical protein JV16_00433 [Anoxybacillus ayderensis]
MGSFFIFRTYFEGVAYNELYGMIVFFMYTFMLPVHRIK